MNCPHCNTEVPPAAARCPACQSPLTPVPSLTGPAGVGLATGMGSGEAFFLRFLAYLIEFARALVTRREPDAETIDAVVLAGLAVVTLWMLPALTRSAQYKGRGQTDPAHRTVP